VQSWCSVEKADQGLLDILQVGLAKQR
jgi:hypothetical protein